MYFRIAAAAPPPSLPFVYLSVLFIEFINSRAMNTSAGTANRLFIGITCRSVSSTFPTSGRRSHRQTCADATSVYGVLGTQEMIAKHTFELESVCSRSAEPTRRLKLIVQTEKFTMRCHPVHEPSPFHTRRFIGSSRAD